MTTHACEHPPMQFRNNKPVLHIEGSGRRNAVTKGIYQVGLYVAALSFTQPTLPEDGWQVRNALGHFFSIDLDTYRRSASSLYHSRFDHLIGDPRHHRQFDNLQEHEARPKIRAILNGTTPPPDSFPYKRIDRPAGDDGVVPFNAVIWEAFGIDDSFTQAELAASQYNNSSGYWSAHDAYTGHSLADFLKVVGMHPPGKVASVSVYAPEATDKWCLDVYQVSETIYTDLG